MDGYWRFHGGVISTIAEHVTRWGSRSQGSSEIPEKKYDMGMKCIFRYFLERVEARNRMYIIISCQKKNPEQTILIFHDENVFPKFGEKNSRQKNRFFFFGKVNKK